MITQQAINLIDVGRHSAIPAGEVEEGDTLMWNYGCTSEVVGFGRETKAFVTLVFADGYERRLKKDRLVALAI